MNKIINKYYTFSLATILFLGTGIFSANAETVNIKSLNYAGQVRDLCIAKRSNNLRYKKCDGKSPQRFEIKGRDVFKISRKSKCIIAEFKADVSEIRKDTTKNVRIKMGSCNPPSLNPNKDELKDLVVAFWLLDRGNRIRLKDNIGNLDICLSDGDRNDKIRAVDCSNRDNPGRWQLSAAQ